MTKNLALSFTAARKASNDKLGLYANSVYATNDAPGATPAESRLAVTAVGLEGKVIGVSSIVRDITKLKLAEEALRQS